MQEQARKALESALGGKRNEFEKWNKEIKKREEVGGGGDAGGGGWFGWGGRFGWSNGDHFWQESQQAILTVLGIIFMVRSFLAPPLKILVFKIRHESFVPLSVSHNVFCRLQYLIVAKGEVLLAVILNPLLYAFRGPRNVLGFITSRISGQTSPDSTVDYDLSKKDASSNTSAKERVLRKWGSE